MTIFFRYISLTLLLLNASPVLAEQFPFTEQELNKVCNDQSSMKFECMIYIRGFMDGAVARQAIPSHFCLTGLKNALQALPVLQKYLREHPENLHYEAAIVAAKALDDAFPCKNSKKHN